MKNSEVDDGLAENVGIVSNENYTPLLRPLLPQIMITLAVGIISFSCGISIGHTAVLIPRLRQNDSSLPTDEDMGSWIASAQTLGMVMGNIVGGALADRLGRRMVVRGTQVPYIIGWVLTASATSHGVMIFARLVLGLARGMTADAMLVLLDENSDARFRGTATSCLGIFYVVGMLAVTGVASHLQWRLVTWLAVLGPVSAFILTYFIPESAMWLVRHGRQKEASLALDRLWGRSHRDKAKQELIYFKKRVQKEQLLWKKSFADYCRALRSRQVCKPFTFSLIFFILNVLCGTQLFVYYTVDIIATALRGRNHHMDEFSAATIAGFLRLVMTMVTCALLYVVRRRMLLFISGIGTASCMLILGIILQMNSSGNLISELSEERLSLTLLFLYVCFSSVGLLVVPFLMMGEMLPNRIRGFASGVICSLNDILMIGVVKIYPWYNRVAGIEGVCWLFGGFSVLTSVFVYLFIPETQGKSLAQIEEYFQQYNILWVTRPKISHKGLELSNRTDTDKLCKEAEDGSSLEKSNPISNRDHILSQDVRS
ncbi:facilitated trehalose transporter Tret1-2 homolog isoform X1 [Periplaneta americana]|uniref:facilitated trehalose transporter Tret1-2 homolog isoform X1 n=1 Tax=Periplaneta americana TaxID=6978 RepID=UPI0037E749BB